MRKQGVVVEVLEVECCPSVLVAPLDAEAAAEMARGFSALGDPARLRILSILAAAPEGEVCVCDFIGPVGKSQPTISHHLKSLGDAGLVHGDYAKELEAYVKGAGIPALDVIGWATRNGAEMLGMKDDLGTIEAGKLADLLVINGDPVRDITVLQDRANLDVIMKGGKFIECQLTPGKAAARAA